MGIEIRIRPGGPECLRGYGQVPIAFTVKSVFAFREIIRPALGIELIEEPVSQPYVKDYDAVRGEGPRRWADKFDVSGWGILFAFDGPRHVGGAVVAPGSHLPDAPRELATLFDIRIAPDSRRRGIGAALLAAGARWAPSAACRLLQIETQNTNVPACRFYASQGCRLGAIDRHAYAAHPQCAHEVRLLWYLDL